MRGAKPVYEAPQRECGRFTGGLGAGNSQVVLLTGGLDHAFGPRVPTEAVFVPCFVVRPEYINDVLKMVKLAKSPLFRPQAPLEAKELNFQAACPLRPGSAIQGDGHITDINCQ